MNFLFATLVLFLGFPLLPSVYSSWNLLISLLLLVISCLPLEKTSNVRPSVVITIIYLVFCAIALFVLRDILSTRALYIAISCSLVLIFWISTSKLQRLLMNISNIKQLLCCCLFFSSYLLFSQFIQIFSNDVYVQLQQNLYPIEKNLWNLSSEINVFSREYRVSGFMVIPTFSTVVSSLYLLVASSLLCISRIISLQTNDFHSFRKCKILTIMVFAVSIFSSTLSLSRVTIPFIALGFVLFLASASNTFYASFRQNLTLKLYAIVSVSLILLLLVLFNVISFDSSTSESYKLELLLRYLAGDQFPLSIVLPGFAIPSLRQSLIATDNDVLFFVMFSPVAYMFLIWSFVGSSSMRPFMLAFVSIFILASSFASSGITLFSGLRTFPLLIGFLSVFSILAKLINSSYLSSKQAKSLL